MAMPVCLLVSDQTALADEPVNAAWIEAQIARSKSFEIPENIHVQWRYETHRLMMDHDLLALRQRVANKPDHPDRFRLVMEEQRIESGPELLLWELLYEHSRRWRINRTNKSSESYVDMGYNNGSAWQNSPGQAQLISESSAPMGFEPASRRGWYESAMKHFVLGPYFLSPRHEFFVTSFTEDSQGGFMATVERTPDPRTYRFTRVIDKEGPAYIERLAYDSDGSLVSISLHIEDAAGDGLLGDTVFSRTVWYHPDGSINRLIQLESVSRLSLKELDAALKPPGFGGVDPFRGVIDATQIHDLRTESPVIREVDQEGVVTRHQPGASEKGPGVPAGSVWRLSGWISGAVLLAAGALVWWTKRGNTV